MSFSGLLTALAEYVGDVIVNDCGRDAPERVLRYHGSSGMPQDCCTEAGYLVASWDRAFASSAHPTPNTRAGECALVPTKQISLRYVTCWPLPDVGPSGVRPVDDEWDPKAAALADLEDCVTRSLLRFVCSPTVPPEEAERREFFDAVIEQAAGCARFSYLESQPIGPSADCAGVLWRVVVGLRSAAPEAS